MTIDINGDVIDEITIDGQRVSEVTADGEIVFSPPAIPDSEDFEHNDLTGNYGGDTGSFNIQAGTVSEGSYALFGDGGGSSAGIVRSTGDPFSRSQGLRITWQQRNEGVNGGGGLLLATSVTGHSSANGYYFYNDPRNNNFNLRILDNGSMTLLASSNSPTGTGSFYTHTVEITDSQLSFSAAGSSPITSSSTDYTSFYLGFQSYRDVYIDNVRFEAI